jgi:hypothetical protein
MQECGALMRRKTLLRTDICASHKGDALLIRFARLIPRLIDRRHQFIQRNFAAVVFHVSHRLFMIRLDFNNAIFSDHLSFDMMLATATGHTLNGDIDFSDDGFGLSGFSGFLTGEIKNEK